MRHIGTILFPAIAAAAGRAAETVPAAGSASDVGEWTCIAAETAFSPRDTAEGVVFDGKMWLSNGWHPPQVLTRDLWCSTDGAVWRRVNSSTPYDGYSEMVVYRGRMWAIKASVWTSTNGTDWEKVSEKTPFGTRGYGEAVVFRDRIWQLGSGADVWHTEDGLNWTCATTQAPYGDRSATAVAVYRDRLWLMAGKTPGANNPPEKGYKDITTHDDVWCSTDGAAWERIVEHAPWPPREWAVAIVYRNRLWLIGGHDNVNSTNLGDVWYTTDGKDWKRFESRTRFSPRHEVTPYVHAGSLWVVAGNAWPVQNDVWRLTLPEDGPAAGPDRPGPGQSVHPAAPGQSPRASAGPDEPLRNRNFSTRRIAGPGRHP